MNLRNIVTRGAVAVLVCALAFGLAPDVTSQTTTGKISGLITDAKGEPLPGANVVLVGTRQGGVAGVNGEYFILQIQPGTYKVSSSLVGFQTVTQTDVQVLVDRTVTLDFSLTESALELDELVVTADQDPIKQDVSYAQQEITIEMIQAVPVGPRIREMMATQVGVDTDDWGLTIRGANEEKLMFVQDGIGQKDNRNNRPYTSYSTTSIQQIQILTGGFNAEYGDVSGGVVHVITKDPRRWMVAAEGRLNPAGRKHFGPEVYSADNWWDVGRFQSLSPTADTNGDGEPDFKGWTQEWNDRGGPQGDWTAGITGEDVISTPEQARAIWEWQHRAHDGVDFGTQFNAPASDRDGDYVYDYTIGGPLVQDKISFLFSDRKERTAYVFDLATPTYRDHTTNFKAIFRPTGTTKLTLGWLRGWSNATKRGDFTGTYVRSDGQASSQFDDVEMFMPGSGNNIQTITRNFGTLFWSHTLSPSTFYTISGRFGKTDWLATWHDNQQVGVAVAAALPDGSISTNISAAGAVILDEAPRGMTYQQRKTDILGIYRLRGGGGASRAGDWSDNTELDFQTDFTSQITPNHQIKAGFQYHSFNLHERRGFISLVPTLSDTKIDWSDKAQITALTAAGETLTVTQTANLHIYDAEWPTFGGVFVQDKMEFREIVANIGIRLDWHTPAKWWDLSNFPHAPWYGIDAVTLYAHQAEAQPPTNWAISPRFGISHPITVDSKMFFNYGHFNQIPTTVETYRAQSGVGEPLETFGNPWMVMPRTIQYELGYERSFLGKYLSSATVYFKDTESEIWDGSELTIENSTRQDTNFSVNGIVSDQRGLELKFQKARGQFLTGFISYDFRVERTKIVGIAQYFDVNTVSEPSRSRIQESPNAANPPFKAQPVWKVNANFRTPLDYGGASSLWQGGWEANMFIRRKAGQYFSYNPSNDSRLTNVRNAQWSDEWTVNIRLAKAFDLPASPHFFLEVTNPFDIKFFDSQGDNNGGKAFEYPGTSTNNRFDTYMQSIGWVLDSSGTLQKGKRPGTDVDKANDMRRPYQLFLNKRDITFGLRFSY